MKRKTQAKGVVMLLLTALIWGAAFVAQSVGIEKIGPFTFNGIRTLMGALALLPFVIAGGRLRARMEGPAGREARRRENRRALRCGLLLGLVFCVASNLQQYAFVYSTPGKIAFITALYMFFVPLFGLFVHKRVPWLTWLCVVVGFVGLYFLCIDPSGEGGVNFGDILAFACSIFFAVHILLVERMAGDVSGIKLSCIQMAVSGVLSCALMFLFETPQVADIGGAIVPLLYAGVLSCGLAYTFQILGQRYTEATVASLLMCMESVFAVLAAALLMGQMLTGRELLGCLIMFAAIILSQLSEARAARRLRAARQCGR